MLVECLNCGIIWRRVTDMDNPGGTVPYTDIQYICPKCGSNAWKIHGERSNTQKRYGKNGES